MTETIQTAPSSTATTTIVDTTSSKPSKVEVNSDETSSSKESPPQKKRRRSTSPEGPQSTHLKGAEAPPAVATTTAVQPQIDYHQQLPPAPAPTPVVALPPSIPPYPHHSQHPHLYYPVYHPQQPYLLSINPQLPVSPSLSPKPPSTAATPVPIQPSCRTSNAATASIVGSSNASAPQRILPKSPVPISTAMPTMPHIQAHPTTPYAAYYYPYPLHLSPQLHPSNTATPPPTGAVSPVPYHPHRASAPMIVPAPSSATSTADQREQARKLSHSAIERRRREKINDKILQLRELIPSCAERNDLHKMTILQSAIDYITYLKKVVSAKKEAANNNDEENHAATKAMLDSSSLLDGTMMTPSSMSTEPQPSSSSSSSSKICNSMPKQVEYFTHQFSIHENKATSNNSPKPNATGTPFKRVIAQIGMDEEDEEDGGSYASSSPVSFTARNNYSATSSISSPSPLLPASRNSNNTTLQCLKPKDIIQMSKNKKRCREDHHEDSLEPLMLPPKVIVDDRTADDKKSAVVCSSSSTASASTVSNNMNLNNLLC